LVPCLCCQCRCSSEYGPRPSIVMAEEILVQLDDGDIWDSCWQSECERVRGYLFAWVCVCVRVRSYGHWHLVLSRACSLDGMPNSFPLYHLYPSVCLHECVCE